MRKIALVSAMALLLASTGVSMASNTVSTPSSHVTVQDVLKNIATYETQTGDLVTFSYEKKFLEQLMSEKLPQLQKEIQLATNENKNAKQNKQAWDSVIDEIKKLIEKTKMTNRDAGQSLAQRSSSETTSVARSTSSVESKPEPTVSPQPTPLSTTAPGAGEPKDQARAPVVPSQAQASTFDFPPAPSSGATQPNVYEQQRQQLKKTPMPQVSSGSSAPSVTPPDNWSTMSVKDRAKMLQNQGFNPQPKTR